MFCIETQCLSGQRRRRSERHHRMSEKQRLTPKQSTSETKRQRLHKEQEQEQEDDFFFINDHVDILVEILRRLDGPSLCSAACVCRLWSSVAGNDAVWEDLCLRHVTPRPSASLRSVVSALGGYRRLYMLCIRPVLTRLHPTSSSSSRASAPWSRDQLQLSLSLFCVDYYERHCVGAWLGDAPSPSSLIFLRKPVNVV